MHSPLANSSFPADTREPVDHYFLRLALLTSTRATCTRRRVGCILVDSSRRVLATGYNGSPRGFTHCAVGNECPGANCPSGTGLELCQAIHAEQNALLQCGDVDAIHSVYVTASPCVVCTKLLLNTAASRIIFLEEYPHPAARELWLSAPRKLEWSKVILP